MREKAVFLDRDGTLIEDKDYLTDPAGMNVTPGAYKAVQELRQAGYKIIVVTNQSAVARGMIDEDKLQTLHERLKATFAAAGAPLDAVYYCPYHPEGTQPEYTRESDWRKPAPGMLIAAAEEYDLDLEQSWMVGDSLRDVEAGRRAGCRSVLLTFYGTPPDGENPETKETKPDFVCPQLGELAELIDQAEPRTESAIPQAEHQPEAPSEPSPPVVEKKPAPGPGPNRQEILLNHIYRELQKQTRPARHPAGQFSIGKLLAGILQMIVLLCLLLAYLAHGRADHNAAMELLTLSGVLQIMTLTLMMMHWQR